MPRILNQEKKQEIYNYYKNNPISKTGLAKKYNVSLPTIIKITQGLPVWSKSKCFSPNLDEHWFQNIDTQNKAYYLGLFITDGNIHVSNRTQANCNITQSLKDSYILEKWLDLVGSNRQIANDGRGCGQAVVISDIMKDDLEQYGIVPKKTLLTNLPVINDEYMSHLIRGLIDGDGHIEAGWYIPKDGRRRFKHKISLCGTHSLCEQVRDFLCNHLQLQVRPDVYDYKNKNLSEIGFTNYEDILKVGNYIYKDAEVFLQRKKDKFDEILTRIKDMATMC